MQRRQDLVNAVIRAIGARSFLQFGSARYFDEVECPVKKSHHVEAADEIPTGARYDVVFVDPPHDAGRASFALQVALEHVSPTGVVLVANVNPAEAWMQEVPASRPVQLGQAWRAWVEFRSTCGRYSYTADMDHGVGVMTPTSAPVRFPVHVDFETFTENRVSLLNLTSPDEVVRALRADAQRDAVMEIMTGAASPAPSKPVADTVAESAAPTRRRRRDR